MKISIITPTYNSARTLQETLESISQQSYRDFEHIIIDGGSTDKTLEILEQYGRGKSWVKIISEKDRGIYDAMNKGIALAQGDIIHILNSDDFYQDEQVLEKVVEKFNQEPVDVCYGDMVLVNRANISQVTRIWRAGIFNTRNINNGWAPPHPTLFVKKEIYNQLGNFSLDFSIASDYDFMLRVMKLKNIQFGYIPEVLVRMRDAGNSGSSLSQRIRGWRDLRKSWMRNGYHVPLFFIVRRIISKIPQYLTCNK